MIPSGAPRADHDHEAEHEQRVREDRADDRRLRDDQLALLSAKITTNNSGRLPSVDCSISNTWSTYC